MELQRSVVPGGVVSFHLCDWLEQAPRVHKWDYRRLAYRQMAERLGGVALVAYERILTTTR